MKILIKSENGMIFAEDQVSGKETSTELAAVFMHLKRIKQKIGKEWEKKSSNGE